MSTLSLIAAQYREQAAQLASLDIDEQTLADTLESLSGELEVRAQSVGHVVRALEADAAAVKQWAKDAQERAKAMESRADSLRDYLSRKLLECGIQKVSGPGIAISFRKSSAVQIDEPGLLPAEYWTQPEPPPPAPAKAAIADALKAGREVPGAHLETRTNIQIK
jgi:hypothetical protein